ncbi:MAG: Gfo/Idh/MocA family oxidoreductase [Planctomycetota bacterium]
MLKSAIVGVGFMGWIHYLAYQRAQSAELKAFCSRDPEKRAGNWTEIQGNFGPPGEHIYVEGLNVYETLEQVLEDSEVDLVDICLPPNLHVEAVCKSLEAGKHVLCEKPLGLNTEDCDKIMGAAKSADRKVMVAQVLPYMGEFQYAYRAAAAGTFGKPKRATLKRAISPPDWIPNFYERSEVGGPLIDLHVHDTHFVRLLFGMPKRVMCSAEMKNGLVKYCLSLMEFDDPNLIVSTSSGVSDQTARPFCHGFELQFEKAAMQFELAALSNGANILPLTVMGQDGVSTKPELGVGDEVAAFTAEIDDAVKSIQTGNTEARLDGAIARDAIHICQCLQQSAESGDWVACK